MCEIQITTQQYDFIVNGTFTDAIDLNTFKYIAASPGDYRASFSGSALPYHGKSQAYENTPNIGTIIIPQGSRSFSIRIQRPNSYYENDALVTPYLLILYSKDGVEKTIKVNLNETCNRYRTLKHDEGYNAMFYSTRNQEVRSQERILRESSYDFASAQAGFWGSKPPA